MFVLTYDLTGLDTLAIAKRGESQSEAAFKVPKEITTSIAAAGDDEDESSIVEESEHTGARRSHRRYRETTSETSRAGIYLVI